MNNSLTNSDTSRIGTSFVMPLLIVTLLMIDGLAPLMLQEESMLVYCFIGFVIAQINLIAAWSALGPDRYIVRIPWCCFLIAMVWLALIAGIRVSIVRDSDGLPDDQLNRRDMIQLGLFLFGAFVLLQLPLWLAGTVFRWKLKERGENEGSCESTDRPRFNLKHILSGMFFFSLPAT